jgi:hypothetical protein
MPSILLVECCPKNRRWCGEPYLLGIRPFGKRPDLLLVHVDWKTTRVA